MKNLFFTVVALFSIASAFAVDFKAGYARVDITAPLGCDMPGYYVTRNAKSILDPLEMVCVAFSDGKNKALIFQVDTEAIANDVATQMRTEIEKATGVNRDAILIHASHTHVGGPLVRHFNPGGRSKELAERTNAITELYIQLCVTRAVDAATMAIADLKSAKLGCARSEANRISFIRRFWMKDGKVRTNPGVNNPNIVKRVGDPDEQVQVLRVDREGAEPICFINFQTHPDVIGGEGLSADWPGFTRRIFEAATFGKSKCIVINGTQGDVNHVCVDPKPGEQNGLHADFDGADRGYEHAMHMANVLAAAALKVWVKCAPIEAGEIKFAVKNVKVPAQKAKDSDEKNLEWAKKVWDMHVAGKDSELPWKEMELTTEVARAGRICRVAKGPDFFDIPLCSFAIGKSVAFGGFPGEPFNEIGKEIKKASPFKMTILSCLTNGTRGYFPFSDSYEQGGYEPATSPFGPTVANLLIKGELELLGELYK